VGVGKQIKQLAEECVVYGLSGTVAKFIGVFLIPLYTRVFNPHDYGVMALIHTLTGLLGLFVVLGLDNSSARWFYDSDDPAHRRCTISSWFWCQLTVASFIGLTLFLFAQQVARVLLGSEEHTLLIRLAALALPLAAFGKVLGNWLRYQRRAWTTALFNTAASLGSIGVILVFVLVWRWGLVGVFSAGLVTSAITAIAALVILRSWVSPTAVSWARLKDMLAYGLPLIPAALGSWITASSDRFVLRIFRDTSEIGLYSIASSLASGVALITGAFQMAWGPFAFSIHRGEGSSRVYAKVLSLYALGGCFLCTALSLFAALILRLLTTEQYLPAASSVPFLAFAFLLIGAQYIAALGPGIAKKSTPIALSILIAACANVVLNFALIPPLGKEGAAAATMLSYICGVVYLFARSQKLYPLPFRFREAVTCFLFSWALIALDRLFLTGNGLIAVGVRMVMCALFVPLGLSLGIIAPRHFGRLLVHTPFRALMPASWQ